VDIVTLLVQRFRNAMDCANKAGGFSGIACFNNFPRGSCGDTCYLLAEFLLEHDIYSEYVEGMKYPQSHAWLVIANKKDLDRKRNTKSSSVYDDEFDGSSNGYEFIINAIEKGSISNLEYISPDYSSELIGRTIIDITGDQFYNDPEFLYYNKPVYVGEMDEFHSLFEIRNVHECNGLEGVGAFNSYRLRSLYKIIKKYIDE